MDKKKRRKKLSSIQPGFGFVEWLWQSCNLWHWQPKPSQFLCFLQYLQQLHHLVSTAPSLQHPVTFIPSTLSSAYEFNVETHTSDTKIAHNHGQENMVIHPMSYWNTWFCTRNIACSVKVHQGWLVELQTLFEVKKLQHLNCFAPWWYRERHDLSPILPGSEILPSRISHIQWLLKPHWDESAVCSLSVR